MPIHPDIVSRFHHLDGVDNILDTYRDPVLSERRRRFETWDEMGGPPDVAVRDDAAPGPHGSVPVRIYSPSGEGPEPRPGLVWVHGGGFGSGDLDMREADWTAREVCARSGAVVVSVDYRLAVNGVHYPVPHDDTVAAVTWVRGHANELGVDTERLTLGGASAGANLVAGAALKLRDAEGWVPALLILVYGAFHIRQPLPSHHLAAALAELPPVFHAPVSTAHPIEENYLGGPVTSSDGYAFPANGILDGLCPTLMLNAEYDVLRASGEAFGSALALAGVDLKQKLVPGLMHAFLNLPPECEPVNDCLDQMAQAVSCGRL